MALISGSDMRPFDLKWYGRKVWMAFGLVSWLAWFGHDWRFSSCMICCCSWRILASIFACPLDVEVTGGVSRRVLRCLLEFCLKFVRFDSQCQLFVSLLFAQDRIVEVKASLWSRCPSESTRTFSASLLARLLSICWHYSLWKASFRSVRLTEGSNVLFFSKCSQLCYSPNNMLTLLLCHVIFVTCPVPGWSSCVLACVFTFLPKASCFLSWSE